MTQKFIWRLLSRVRISTKYDSLVPARSYSRCSSCPRYRVSAPFLSISASAIQSVRSTSTAPAITPSISATRIFAAANSARIDIHWKMAAQFAKPFTVYVMPDASPSEELSTKRKLRFMFRYTINKAGVGEGNAVDHLLNFERDFDDLLEGTLTRLRMKLIQLNEKSSKSKKKQKRARISPDQGTSNQQQEETKWVLKILTADGSELEYGVTNEVAFLTEGRSLVINDQAYQIWGSAPSVSKAEVDLVSLVGFPVMPSINVSEDSSVDTCQYFWFTGEPSETEFLSKSKVPESIQVTCDYDDNGALTIREMKGWALRSTDRIFVPDQNDLGRHLCFIVTPRNEAGRYGLPRVWTTPAEKPTPAEMFRKGVVIESPSPMVWAERHQLCAKETAKDTIRCVCYNILADLYMNLALPDDLLYFPYCPKRYQEHSYRYPILLKEIHGYQADLYCLQEVDTRMWDRFLEPYLSKQGWKGTCKRKGGVVNEGSAILYRPEKLELLASDDHIISDLLSKSDAFEDLAQVAKQSELVWNIFLTRPATIQVAVFRSLTVHNKFLCVGNTHLHFKPHHSPIRLLQAAAGYRHLLNVASRIKQQYPHATVAVIFCGDFNSTPVTGVFEMFQNGRLNADNRDWQPQADDITCSDSDSEEPAESLAVNGIELTFSKRLRTACPSVRYTTSTHLFRDVLDHIFISDDLVVDRDIPMPNHDLVTKYTGIPSPICPSDHLPLICELKFR